MVKSIFFFLPILASLAIIEISPFFLARVNRHNYLPIRWLNRRNRVRVRYQRHPAGRSFHLSLSLTDLAQYLFLGLVAYRCYAPILLYCSVSRFFSTGMHADASP